MIYVNDFVSWQSILAAEFWRSKLSVNVEKKIFGRYSNLCKVSIEFSKVFHVLVGKYLHN